MDDRTFMAKYVAEESERLNRRMKDVIAAGEPLSEESQSALAKDMEESLLRLKRTLEQLQLMVGAEESAEEA